MFGPLDKFDPSDRRQEERARDEKAAALAEMYASRFTVLNGPAGTGKTRLVEALVHRPEIQAGGVLLVAPTGKARVQLAKKAGTMRSPWRSSSPDRPIRRGHRPVPGHRRRAGSRQKYGLVVVDEASMLTEEMLAALFDALIRRSG